MTVAVCHTRSASRAPSLLWIICHEFFEQIDAWLPYLRHCQEIQLSTQPPVCCQKVTPFSPQSKVSAAYAAYKMLIHVDIWPLNKEILPLKILPSAPATSCCVFYPNLWRSSESQFLHATCCHWKGIWEDREDGHDVCSHGYSAVTVQIP